MEINENLVAQSVIAELDEMLEGFSANHSILGPFYVDLDNQEITIKFRFNIVPEDEYIGLTSY